MRMWMIPAVMLCRQHLLGEHRELHTLAGSLRHGRNIRGSLNKGLLEPQNLKLRHEALVQEMLDRGYNHRSPLEVPDITPRGSVDPALSYAVLRRRCSSCKMRITTLRGKGEGSEG